MSIKFEIVTPERVVLQDDVLHIVVPTREGEITVLPNHIPLVAMLKPGVLEVKKIDGSVEIMSVSGGFLEVLRDKVVVLADTAERAIEIDLDRAEEARARAEKIKREAVSRDDVNYADLSSQIAKELARVHAARKWRKIQRLDNVS